MCIKKEQFNNENENKKEGQNKSRHQSVLCDWYLISTIFWHIKRTLILIVCKNLATINVDDVGRTNFTLHPLND